MEKLNLVLDPCTKDLDFLSDSDKKACWSALEVEFERVVTEMQKVFTNDSDPAVQQQGMGNADKETGEQGEMKRSALHDDCHSSLERVKRANRIHKCSAEWRWCVRSQKSMLGKRSNR